MGGYRAHPRPRVGTSSLSFPHVFAPIPAGCASATPAATCCSAAGTPVITAGRPCRPSRRARPHPCRRRHRLQSPRRPFLRPRRVFRVRRPRPHCRPRPVRIRRPDDGSARRARPACGLRRGPAVGSRAAADRPTPWSRVRAHGLAARAAGRHQHCARPLDAHRTRRPRARLLLVIGGIGGALYLRARGTAGDQRVRRRARRRVHVGRPHLHRPSCPKQPTVQQQPVHGRSATRARCHSRSCRPTTMNSAPRASPMPRRGSRPTGVDAALDDALTQDLRCQQRRRARRRALHAGRVPTRPKRRSTPRTDTRRTRS